MFRTIPHRGSVGDTPRARHSHEQGGEKDMNRRFHGPIMGAVVPIHQAGESILVPRPITGRISVGALWDSRGDNMVESLA